MPEQPEDTAAPGPVGGFRSAAHRRRAPELFRGNALDAYPRWPAPATIISDGPYGAPGFGGDAAGPDALRDWYRPHIEAWAAAAAPASTLWFWNTELGWASVHPVLAAYGWDYVQLIIWNKDPGAGRHRERPGYQAVPRRDRGVRLLPAGLHHRRAGRADAGQGMGPE